jgi:hypothetical protein
MMTRQNLIDRAQQDLRDIRQYFVDIAHHNQTTLPEDYVEPDPDGSVLSMAHALEKFVHVNSPVIGV